ncbi:hypothetical protein WR25_01404 [Diploscapter pachys]|uniref:RNA helicase n=1 Tax=Diploscapter pachys TaxID=2018661 RepID=A0A2A2LB55_9BILA|nr:hypothetical protein WR25_01404 [Diploscapter pachys]
MEPPYADLPEHAEQVLRYDSHSDHEYFNGPPCDSGFGFDGRNRSDSGYGDYNRDTNGLRGGNRNSDFGGRRDERNDYFAMPNVLSFNNRNNGGFISSRSDRGRYENDHCCERAVFSEGPLFVENSRFSNFGEGFEKNRAPRYWVPDTENAENLQKEDKEFLKGLDDALQDTPVEIEGGADLPPFETWEDSGLDPRLIENCRKSGYRKPRPIQAALIPHILHGDNAIGVTETGSGKTASFVLPILNQILAMGKDRIDEERRKLRPFAIIVTPVRELAKQIYHHFIKMAVGTGIAIALSYGEMNKEQSIAKMSEGCHVLVGTSGRLMDFVTNATIGLKNLKYFVFDGMDRMLQNAQGRFDNEHLMAIVHDYSFPKPTERQTLLFSATFDKETEGIAVKVMGDPNGRGLLPYVKAKHSVNTRANKRVHQQFIQTDGIYMKNEELLRILRESKDNFGRVPRTLIFVSQKKRSDILAQAITMDRAGFKAASINGDRPQDEREKALSQFEKGDVDILVATDVCSRIGRTGRLKNGRSTTFISEREPNDVKFTPTLVELVEEVGQVAPEWLREVASSTDREESSTSEWSIYNSESSLLDDLGEDNPDLKLFTTYTGEEKIISIACADSTEAENSDLFSTNGTINLRTTVIPFNSKKGVRRCMPMTVSKGEVKRRWALPKAFNRAQLKFYLRGGDKLVDTCIEKFNGIRGNRVGKDDHQPLGWQLSKLTEDQIEKRVRSRTIVALFQQIRHLYVLCDNLSDIQEANSQYLVQQIPTTYISLSGFTGYGLYQANVRHEFAVVFIKRSDETPEFMMGAIFKGSRQPDFSVPQPVEMTYSNYRSILFSSTSLVKSTNKPMTRHLNNLDEREDSEEGEVGNEDGEDNPDESENLEGEIESENEENEDEENEDDEIQID